MSFRTQEDQRRAVEAAALEKAKRETVAAVYQKFPLLVRCMANDQHIIGIVTRFAGPDALPSLDLFLSALDENPDELRSLAQQSEAITRRQLTAQIIDLLAAKGKGHDSFTLAQEQKRLALLSVPALRARLADLQVKAKMASVDVGSLKAYVAEERRDKREFPGYPELPKSVWNGTTHVPVNAAFFKSLDGYEIRRYTRLYSVEQVNQRIQKG
jgi:hypothetical protein